MSTPLEALIVQLRGMKISSDVIKTRFEDMQENLRVLLSILIKSDRTKSFTPADLNEIRRLTSLTPNVEETYDAFIERISTEVTRIRGGMETSQSLFWKVLDICQPIAREILSRIGATYTYYEDFKMVENGEYVAFFTDRVKCVTLGVYQDRDVRQYGEKGEKDDLVDTALYLAGRYQADLRDQSGRY